MKYIIPAILCAFLVATLSFAEGTGTIGQLEQWRRTTTGQITQNTANSIIKLTGYESSGNCLVTDINGVVSTSSCGGGGGGASSTVVKINGTISNTGVPTLDFGSGFTVSESPTDEFNLSVPIYLGTSSPWTIGNVAYVTAAGTLGSTATGTLTDSVTGLSFNSQVRGLLGGAAALSLDTGYSIPTTNSLLTANSSTTGNLAFWSGNQTIGNVATGTLTETVTGLELNATRGLIGGSAILALTSGFVMPTSTLWTSVADFFQTPSTRITAGTGLSWAGNTLNATAGTIYLATTSVWTTGNLARVASNGTVDSVATSTLGLSPAFTTSAVLAALLSDELGTGRVVFASSTMLTSPTINGTADFSGAIVKQKTYKSFTAPGFSATTTVATTTVEVGSAGTSEQWNWMDCRATNSTINFVAKDGGGNLMNAQVASTSVGRINLTTNNTFTAGEQRKVDIGPITSGQLTCTVEIVVNN